MNNLHYAIMHSCPPNTASQPTDGLVIAAAGNGVEVDVNGVKKSVGIPIEGEPTSPADWPNGAFAATLPICLLYVSLRAAHLPVVCVAAHTCTY